MKCVICKNGETEPGTTTFTLTRGATIIIVKDVPAKVCDNCEEAYVSGETSEQLRKAIDSDVNSGAEVVVEVVVRSYTPI